MDKIKIKNPFSLPAAFVSASADSDNPLFTRAKLKVFYVGETADKRLFSKDFANKLLKTLPYSPVVSKYNEKDDDFEGHASEQNIYGIVDPLVEPTFEVVDGVEWAVCDVILYTKRPGQTGEIASKIIGHAQSLELDPSTVQYKINRESGTGKFKNIEFIDGNFIGVSVLGKNQEPAFTGSAFFDSNLMERFAEVYKTRGDDMEIKIPLFLNESWGQRYEMLNKALVTEYPDDFFYIVDFYDDAVIFKLFTETDSKLLKSKYAIVEDSAVLEEAKKVRIEYVEVPGEVEPKEEDDDKDDNDDDKKPPVVMATEEPPVEETKTELTVETPPAEEVQPVVQPNATAEQPPVATEPSESSVSQSGEEGHDKDVEKEKEAANLAASIENERRELENYRRQDKISIIESFSDIFDEAELDKYIKNVDNYNRDELKADLAIKALEVARHTQNTGFRAVLPTAKRTAKSEDEALAERLRARSTKK